MNIKLYNKVCKNCNNEYISKDSRTKFCSHRCSAIYSNKRRDTENYKNKISKTLKEGIKSGRIKKSIISEESKNKMRDAIYNRIDKGLFGPNFKATIRHYINDSFGNKVCLQGSWELKVAEFLNKKNIKWTRPGSIKYSISGVVKRYLPDFYLPDIDLYLDPKNPWVMKISKDKIEAIRISNSSMNLLILSDVSDENLIDKLGRYLPNLS